MNHNKKLSLMARQKYPSNLIFSRNITWTEINAWFKRMFNKNIKFDVINDAVFLFVIEYSNVKSFVPR